MKANGIFDELVEVYCMDYYSSELDKLISRGWKIVATRGRDDLQVILQRTHKLNPSIIRVLSEIKDFIDGINKYSKFKDSILHDESLNSESPFYCIPSSVKFDLYNNLRTMYDLLLHDEYNESEMKDKISSMFKCYLYD